MTDLKQPNDVSHIPVADDVVQQDAGQFVAELFRKNDVVVISDTNHKNQAIADTFASLIPAAAKDQPVLVFIETGRDEQPAVDRYFETGEAKHIEGFIGGKRALNEDVLTDKKTDMRPILIAGRQAGAKVYCMDRENGKKITVLDAETLYDKSLYIQRHGKPGKEAEAEKEFEEQLAKFKQSREAANAEMVALIKQKREEYIQANPGTEPKILVMVGAGHTRNDRHPVRADIDEMLAESLGKNTVNVSMLPASGDPLHPYVKPGGSMRGGMDQPEFTMYLPNPATIDQRNANRDRIEQCYQRADALLASDASTGATRVEREELATSVLKLQASVEESIKACKLYTTPKDQLTPDQQYLLGEIRRYNDPGTLNKTMQVASRTQAGLEEVSRLLTTAEPDYQAICKKIELASSSLKGTLLESQELDRALSGAGVLSSRQSENDRRQVKARVAFVNDATATLKDQVMEEAAGVARAFREVPDAKSPAVGAAWRSLAAKVTQLVEEKLKDSQEPMTPGARRIVAYELASKTYQEARLAGTAPKELSSSYKSELGAGQYGIDATYVQKLYERLNAEDKAVESTPGQRAVPGRGAVATPGSQQAATSPAQGPGEPDPTRLEAAVTAVAALDKTEFASGDRNIGRDGVVSAKEIARSVSDRDIDGIQWDQAQTQQNARTRSDLLEKLDLDGDGQVTKNELASVIAALQKSGVRLDEQSFTAALGNDIAPASTPGVTANGKSAAR